MRTFVCLLYVANEARDIYGLLEDVDYDLKDLTYTSDTMNRSLSVPCPFFGITCEGTVEVSESTIT